MLAVIVLLAFGARLTKPNYTCDADYVLFEKYCYRFSKDADVYNYAVEDCIAEGAHLVSIHSASANTFIRSQAKDDILIGLQYQPATLTYNWSDTSSLDYNNYVSGFEAFKDYFGLCARINSDGEWANTECEVDDLKYVCKKQATSQSLTNNSVCPDQKLYVDSGELTSPGYPGTYDGSSPLNCSYKLTAKNDYFISILVEEANLGSDHVYVYKSDISGKLRLITTITHTLYNVSTLIRQNLVQVVFSGKGSGKWKIKWGSVKTETACEQSTPFRINDWCYYYNGVVSNSLINYCNNECLYNLRADILSIHSQAEQDLLTSMVPNAPRYAPQIIGLKYHGDGQWNWMDGTTFDYTHFASGYTPTTDASYQIYNSGGSWINAAASYFNYQINCRRKASVLPVIPKGCQDSSVIFETSGELFSPGFPEVYADADLFGCKIHLRAKTGYNIYLYATVMYASHQVLTVYNGWNEGDDHVLGVFEASGYKLLSTSNDTNTVLIVHSDVQSTWWTVSWYSTKDPNYIPAMLQVPKVDSAENDAEIDAWKTLASNLVECPSTVMTQFIGFTHIAITSPGYPSGYPASEDCVYYSNSTGALPSGHYWRIIFMGLNIGNDDYIKLVDLRTNTVFATTDTIIRESLALAADFEFAIEFHSGSVQSNHELWRIVQHNLQL